MSAAPVPGAAPNPTGRPPTHSRRRVALLGARVLIWGVYAYVLITELILALGFMLLLFGANSDASFVAWVYRSMERAMDPFRGMFTPVELGLGRTDEVGAVLDTSMLFAILVYAIAAWLLSAVLAWTGDFLATLTAAEEHAAYVESLASQSAQAVSVTVQHAPKNV